VSIPYRCEEFGRAHLYRGGGRFVEEKEKPPAFFHSSSDRSFKGGPSRRINSKVDREGSRSQEKNHFLLWNLGGGKRDVLFSRTSPRMSYLKCAPPWPWSALLNLGQVREGHKGGSSSKEGARKIKRRVGRNFTSASRGK